jgi:hypothetical protein
MPREMEQPTFQRLAEAVAFLASRLDAGKLDEIADACPDYGDDTRSYRMNAIRALVDYHGEVDLRQRYESREFPSLERKFKLGGHGAELGHVHIDFAKASDGWQIANIFICR